MEDMDGGGGVMLVGSLLSFGQGPVLDGWEGGAGKGTTSVVAWLGSGGQGSRGDKAGVLLVSVARARNSFP